jgi:hypothetical protein
MPPLSPRRLLAACALSSAVLGGCHFADSHSACPSCAEGVPLATTKVDADGSWSGVSLDSASADHSTAGSPTGRPKMVSRAGVLKWEQKGPPETPVPDTAEKATPDAPDVDDADIETAKLDRPAFPRGEPVTARKSFSDITAHPSFSHAEDYTWISGEVQKWRHEWRLRYASVDEVDPYGGSLTLGGEEHFDQLKEGEHIKLEGHIVTSDSKTAGPVFLIDAVLPAAQ